MCFKHNNPASGLLEWMVFNLNYMIILSLYTKNDSERRQYLISSKFDLKTAMKKLWLNIFLVLCYRINYLRETQN